MKDTINKYTKEDRKECFLTQNGWIFNEDAVEELMHEAVSNYINKQSFLEETASCEANR